MPFNNAGAFLISTLFNLYLFVVLLRLILQLVGANFYNPISQFVIKLTDPVLIPLRKFIPKISGIDLPIIILLIVIEMVKIGLLVLISMQGFPHIGGVFIWAIADLFKQTVNLFFYAILIMVIISWVNPQLNTPVTEVLFRVTEPLMAPVRRIIPPVGGFDITPIPVLIGLQLMMILLISPLMRFGISLAL